MKIFLLGMITGFIISALVLFLYCSLLVGGDKNE